MIGFVFWGGAERDIVVTPCGIRGCGDIGLSEIGFVLRKRLMAAEVTEKTEE